MEGFFKCEELTHGKITYPSGVIKEGSFVEGKLHGEGKITLADGQMIKGRYVHDSLQLE